MAINLNILFAVLTLSMVVIGFAPFNSLAEGDLKDHAGHSHQKIDKDSPEYQKYIKKKVEAKERHMKELEEFDKSDKFNKALLNQNLEHDINVGDVNAPIKIVEYASLSCGHCKNFHNNVYYPLKKEYIDSGLVHFKYRNYPLNGAAVKGSVILACADENVQQAMLGGLFKVQSQWAYAKSESQLMDRLKTASLIAGIDEKKFQECYENEEIEKAILEHMKQANTELNVTSTPTIFINGVRYLQARDFESISMYIDNILKNKGVSKPIVVTNNE